MPFRMLEIQLSGPFHMIEECLMIRDGDGRTVKIQLVEKTVNAPDSEDRANASLSP